MLDIRWIRDNPNALVNALIKRGQDADVAQSTVDGLIAADEARRDHVSELQAKQERRNAASKEIGNAMRAGDMVRADELKAEVADIKAFIQSGEARERELDKALDDALAVIPNVPLDDVPVGRDEKDNVEIRRWGEDLIAARRTALGSNKPKEHFELGEALGQMDFERAAKLSGARFTVLSGRLARLERALGQFMLDLHTESHGYTEVQPPLLVRDHALYGTGQLPKFEEDLFITKVEEMIGVDEYDIAIPTPGNLAFSFKGPRANEILAANPDGRIKVFLTGVQSTDLKVSIRPLLETKRYLIPTSEVPLTNLVREEIVAQDSLPRRYTALTPCFRSEAGSAGRDTRGMLRQHQFYKVEMVSITDQESSLAEHERMTACAEEVLKRLGLPYRTVVLCTGDMGFGSRKTYDIEVWLPGQNTWREISSCSVCGDFQARRMDARYRPKDGKGTAFVHTLNGSGVAVGRALIAVMENYQDAAGAITIPEALRPYMGGLEKIEAN